MPGKRKSVAKQTRQSKRVAKNIGNERETRSTRAANKNYADSGSSTEGQVDDYKEENTVDDIDEDEVSDDNINEEEEQVVVVKIKTPKSIQKKLETIISSSEVDKSTADKSPAKSSAVPLSAIAARRAAINAGLYREPAPEDNHGDEEEEPSEEDEEREGIEVQSVTDDEDIERREALEHEEVLPISGTNTPLGASTPNRPSTPIRNSKAKYKIPPLMDYQSVSQFVASNSNSCIVNQEDDTYLFIGLKSGEDILFMGEILVAPLFGSISISGAVISSGRTMPTVPPKEDLYVSFYPVFSPRTHSLLRINSEPADMPSIQNHSNLVEIDENLLYAVFDEFQEDSYKEFETIVAIKDLESGLEDMCDAVSSFAKNLIKLNRKEASRDKSLQINQFPGFHPILEVTPGIKTFKIEHSWQTRTDLALNNASARQSPMVSVVCGAKDMGKSSYSRYLINRLLTKYKKVAYLETDVGQSEFTPSGLLSLHYISDPILGPPFTHQQLEPERSFYFGSTSPRNNPDYYLECINELVDHWKQDQANVRDGLENEWIPIVMNTNGWISGVGYDLLISQIHKLEPTDIFSMRHHVFEYKNLPHSFNLDILPRQNDAFKIEREAPNLHYLDCVLQESNVVTLMDSFTSSQQRDITLSSYFYQMGMGNNQNLIPKWDYSQHLIEKIPWSVDWRQSLNAVWVVYEEVKHAELLYALNGSLVGLIGDVVDFNKQNGPKNTPPKDTFTPPTYFNTQDQPAPEVHKTTCYGVGIIRAIDPSRHAFLILTPVPSSSLEKVSGLVKGELQLPLWTMLDHRLEKNTGVANVPWKKVPYITQQNTEGAGANALRVRRNLLRRSQ